MSSFAREIGECRSWLAQPASEEVFGALCEVVGLTVREADDPLIGYLEEQLKRWPAKIKRVIPEDWLICTRYDFEEIEAIRLCDTLMIKTCDNYNPAELALLYQAAAKARVSALEFITHEDVEQGLHSYYVEVLEQAPQGWPLRRLGLRYCNLYVCAEALTKASCLERLEVLDLRYNKLEDDALLMLMGEPFIETLLKLHLQGNRITSAGAQGIAQASKMARLRWLDLRDNAIGVEGAQALADAAHLASLEWLALYRKDVEQDGVRALAESEHLAPELCRYWRGVLG